MKRICLAVLSLGLATPGFPEPAPSASTMWGCAPPGQRGMMLVLSAGGSVKFANQRIPASHEVSGQEHHWTWGNNSVVLGADGIAQYYEGGDTSNSKGTFKCRAMN